MSKIVGFACLNKNNVFSSYILSKTIYNDDYKILLVSDYVFKKDEINRIKNLNIWNEVIYFREVNIPLEIFFSEIKNQLNEIDLNRMDLLHFYSFGYKSFNFNLFDFIGVKTKIIQTVFCVTEHYIKEYWTMLKEKNIMTSAEINLNYFNKLSEIWVYDKNLYIGDSMGLTIKDIKFEEYLEDKDKLKEVCIDLNNIFNYTYKSLEYDVLFLDQPCAPRYFDNNIGKEMELFQRILSTFNNKKVLIKKHPRSPINKYDDLHVNTIEDNKVPWEVILLNEINHKGSNLKDKLFVSYLSSALVNTHIILTKLKIRSKAIWLSDLLINNSNEPVGYDLYKKFIEELKENYRNNFYHIKDLYSLQGLVQSFTFHKQK